MLLIQLGQIIFRESYVPPAASRCSLSLRSSRSRGSASKLILSNAGCTTRK